MKRGDQMLVKKENPYKEKKLINIGPLVESAGK